MPIEVRILAQLGEGPSHGMAVADELGVPSRTVYYALARLEAMGLMRSRWETPQAARERPRRVFTLTAKGRRTAS